MRRIWAGLLILTVAAAPLLLRGDAKAQKADGKSDAKATANVSASIARAGTMRTRRRPFTA